MSEIHASANFNCRGDIVPSDVIDLAKDIDEYGLTQPVAVRRYTEEQRKLHGMQYKYGLVCGFRRHMAFRVLKREMIPCNIVVADDVRARILNLGENIKRENLNIMQEAKSIAQFKYLDYTMDWIASSLGVSKGWVQVRFNLLDMQPEIQEIAAAGLLSQVQIRDLYAIKDPANRAKAVRAIKEARGRGESSSMIAKSTAKRGNSKRMRTRPELFTMQAEIREAVGPNIITRILGWAAGEVSDYEMYSEMKAYLASEYGVDSFKIPEFQDA